MTVLQYVHFSIELWGAFFCLISVVGIAINREFDKKGSYKLIALMLCSMLLMLSDAMAWMFRGNPSEAGYYIVRISNFCAFFFGFLTMPLVAEYLTHIISKRSGISGLYWKYIEWALFLIGTALLVANSMHEFMYSFDERNTYYRLGLSMLPGMIAFTGIIITIGVVIEYIKYMNRFEKIAMLLYLFLPVIAVVIQMLKYGVSFTYLSIVFSALMLYFSFLVNNNAYNIEKEKKLAEERIRLFNQQIQPHFLFNSLSVIKHLCRKSPDEAAEAIDEFSGYMRGCTDFMNETDCVSAERELNLVKHYIYMQKKRFGDSISFEYDIKDTDFDIPPFAIQTSVENAIKHGLRAQAVENGYVKISTYKNGGKHIVEIEDNGIGFDTNILKDETLTNHVGIVNTTKRLRLMCDGTMDIKSDVGHGTKVTIAIPAR